MILTGDTEVLYQNVSDYPITTSSTTSSLGLICDQILASAVKGCQNKGLALPDYKKGTLFSIHCSPIFERALLCGRFPGFARLSFWEQQREDENE